MDNIIILRVNDGGGSLASYYMGAVLSNSAVDEIRLTNVIRLREIATGNPKNPIDIFVSYDPLINQDDIFVLYKPFVMATISPNKEILTHYEKVISESRAKAAGLTIVGE